jgi:hypothetical protein
MDGPFDELVQRILGGCARDASGRAAHVITEAKREAEEEVKVLVKSAMKAALEGAPTPGDDNNREAAAMPSDLQADVDVVDGGEEAMQERQPQPRSPAAGMSMGSPAPGALLRSTSRASRALHRQRWNTATSKRS